MQPVADLAPHEVGRIGIEQSGLSPQNVEQRVVADLAAERDAAAPKHHRWVVGLPNDSQEFSQESALPDACLSEDGDELHKVRVAAAFVEMAQEPKLGVAADEWGRDPAHVDSFG